MTGMEVLDVARDAVWTIVLVSAPLMVVGLVVGVAVSLVQALTQIQEQTLVFVPKILSIFVTFVLALPFMADALQQLHAADFVANHRGLTHDRAGLRRSPGSDRTLHPPTTRHSRAGSR